jgi:hypothetical protein
MHSLGVFRFSCGPRGELPRFVGVAATPQARRAAAKRHSSAQGQAEANANLMRRALTLMVSTELTVVAIRRNGGSKASEEL